MRLLILNMFIQALCVSNCLFPACPPPPVIDLAEVLPGDNLVGTTRRYECVKGMFATGPITVTCLPNAQWSVPENSCTGRSILWFYNRRTQDFGDNT